MSDKAQQYAQKTEQVVCHFERISEGSRKEMNLKREHFKVAIMSQVFI